MSVAKTKEEIKDAILQVKCTVIILCLTYLRLRQLEDMGFTDRQKSLDFLRKTNGDINATLELLMADGPASPSSPAGPDLLADFAPPSGPFSSAPAAAPVQTAEP